jgi:hypothetical protein
VHPYLFLLSFCIVLHVASHAGLLLHPSVNFMLSSCYFFMLLIKPLEESLLWSLFAYCLFSHLNKNLLTFLPALITNLFFLISDYSDFLPLLLSTTPILPLFKVQKHHISTRRSQVLWYLRYVPLTLASYR